MTRAFPATFSFVQLLLLVTVSSGFNPRFWPRGT